MTQAITIFVPVHPRENTKQHKHSGQPHSRTLAHSPTNCIHSYPHGLHCMNTTLQIMIRVVTILTTALTICFCINTRAVTVIGSIIGGMVQLRFASALLARTGTVRTSRAAGASFDRLQLVAIIQRQQHHQQQRQQHARHDRHCHHHRQHNRLQMSTQPQQQQQQQCEHDDDVHEDLALADMLSQPHRIVRVAQHVWRSAADQHQGRIRDLLQPGLASIPPSDVARRDRRRKRQARISNALRGGASATSRTVGSSNSIDDWVAPLDVQNPVYNFLIEYYGLKGSKGPRQLSRWSPSCTLLLHQQTHIATVEDLMEASNVAAIEMDGTDCESHFSSPAAIPMNAILLEGATAEDFASVLHLRGATIVDDDMQQRFNLPDGALYSPAHFYGKHDATRKQDAARLATPFLWYRSILQNTLLAEPILHCHGLHEWAMQYQPDGAPPPPSAKYQSHLQLRVTRQTINDAVERKGVSCTHVDALRFFAPAVGPLNHHGASLQRTDQLRLEQPACVHAHMDLLKVAMKLRPFCDTDLLCRILAVALESRRLDVAASPYDATAYGVGVVPIETAGGRATYRKRQRELMQKAEPIRRELLRVYDALLSVAFDEDVLGVADDNPLPERHSKAEPGGKPWRKNLIPSQ